MAIVFTDNPAPSALSGDVVYIVVSDALPPDEQAAEVKLALAGSQSFEGHASGGAGVIESPPTRVASDSEALAGLLASTFSRPEGTVDKATGDELPANDCNVVDMDELVGEYSAINDDPAKHLIRTLSVGEARRFTRDQLEGLNKENLVELAERHGVDSSGGKTAIVNRLAEHAERALAPPDQGEAVTGEVLDSEADR